MLNEILTGISPYLWQILGVIITAIASYIGLKLKALYEAKINNETKEKIVNAVVEMVEQLNKKYQWTSEQKYNKAKDTIIRMVEQTGLKITPLELEVLIEAACNSFTKKIKNK
ncbi:MAG: phage holin, LLH family [Tissierellia bacterium]|nr:phage holin, LLH family [Tissierellia bacterium]